MKLRHHQQHTAFCQSILKPLLVKKRSGQCFGLAIAWYLFKTRYPHINFIELLRSAAAKQQRSHNFFQRRRNYTKAEKYALQLISIFQQAQLYSQAISKFKSFSGRLSLIFARYFQILYTDACTLLGYTSRFINNYDKDDLIDKPEQFAEIVFNLISKETEATILLSLHKLDSPSHVVALHFSQREHCYYFFDANLGEYKIQVERLAAFLREYFYIIRFDFVAMNIFAKAPPELQPSREKSATTSTESAATPASSFAPSYT